MQADDRIGLRQLGAEALQPRGVALVQAGPCRLRQRRVGDLAHEAVAEADGRPLAAHEQVAHDQALAGLLELGARDAVGERVHLARLEHLPHDRAQRQHRALRRLEPVQAGGEQRVQRGWKRLRLCAALAEPGDELLEEERVAAGRRGDPLALGRGQASALDRVEKLGHRRARERAELVRQSPPPKRASQPGWRSSSASRRATATTSAGAPRTRSAMSASSSTSAGSARCASSSTSTSGRRRARPSITRRKAHAVSSPAAPSRKPTAAATWRTADGGTPSQAPTLVDRAIARDLLDDRAQRPVGHAAAVRRTAPGEDRGAVAQDDRELGGQARFADPGSPTTATTCAVDVASQRAYASRRRRISSLAPDERAVEPAADRRSVRVEALQPEAMLAERRRARGVADDPPGRRVDTDLLEGRRPAEPLRGADRLAEDRRRAAPRGSHDLARRDAAARAQPERQLPGARDELGGRPQGPLRGVLVGHGRAEDGEHGVAARLDDDAIVLGADLGGVLVVALEHRPQRLGVGAGRVARLRKLREDARHQAPGLRRQRLVTGRGRVRGRGGGNLVAQDRRLERPQVRRRLDAQAVDQRLVCAAVDLERLGLTSGTVEGEHLLAAEALAERVLADERLELAGHLGVAAAGEVRVDAVADARQAKILQPRDLRLREPGVGHVGEGRAAPQLQGASQRGRRLPGLAARRAPARP